MGPISVTIEGGGLQYVIWTNINNSICSQGWVSHSDCIIAAADVSQAGIILCIVYQLTDLNTIWYSGNLRLSAPHLPPDCIVQASSLCLGQMLSCRVWHLTDIRDKTRHQSLSCTTCHQPRQDTGTQIFSWPCLLSVILSVSNISRPLFTRINLSPAVIIHVFQTRTRKRRGGGTDC